MNAFLHFNSLLRSCISSALLFLYSISFIQILSLYLFFFFSGLADQYFCCKGPRCSLWPPLPGHSLAWCSPVPGPGPLALVGPCLEHPSVSPARLPARIHPPALLVFGWKCRSVHFLFQPLHGLCLWLRGSGFKAVVKLSMYLSPYRIRAKHFK